ncbi:MAG TPA: hypothetical protein VLA77_00675 [Candidatus Saccharimonadales bacterium]|nr:hypothetical protein [Candidatus Saccharimonadales bacterium]
MKNFFATLALTLVFALVLSGAHAKDLAALPNAQDTAKAVQHDDTTVKSYSELHNHVDKQTGKNLAGDNPLADNRSLRVREKHSQDIKKMISKLIKNWQHNLFMSLA